MLTDVRWMQRLENYSKALGTLKRAVILSHQRELSELEEQGLIQSFEFTHELSWNLLKDYLESKEVSGFFGSKDTVRQSFKAGIISDGEIWMSMIKDRNLSSHTYNVQTAKEIVNNIISLYMPLFEQLETSMQNIKSIESST